MRIMDIVFVGLFAMLGIMGLVGIVGYGAYWHWFTVGVCVVIAWSCFSEARKEAQARQK